MKKLLILGSLMFIGCGESPKKEAPPPSFLSNSAWILMLNDRCAIGLNLTNSTYIYQTLCLASDSVAYSQMETGKVVDLGNSQLEFLPEKSSCSGIPDVEYSMDSVTMGYTLSANSLLLNSSDGVLSFRTNTASDSEYGFIVSLGCFIEEEFVVSPLKLTDFDQKIPMILPIK